MKKTTVLFIFFLLASAGFAQLIDCQKVYWTLDDKIYEFDPVTKKTTYTGVSVPDASGGLAIGENPNNASENTFFCTKEKFIWYYNGTSWVKTTRAIDDENLAVNIAWGGGNFYMLDVINEKVYKSTGNGPPKYLMKVSQPSGPADLIADEEGNFYLMSAERGVLLKYSSDGKLLKHVRLFGITSEFTGAGFAYVDRTFYLGLSGHSMTGIFFNKTYRFMPFRAMPDQLDNDMASCPCVVYIDEKDSVKVVDTVRTDTVPLVQVDTVPKEVQFAENNIPVSIKDRNVTLQNTLVIDAAEFDIEVYDKSVVDGDSISLNLNGNWILENYLVVKEKKIIHVKIDPSAANNYLILFAHNLGTISPNTATLNVVVGDKRYMVSLSSNLGESGAVNFQFKTD